MRKETIIAEEAAKKSSKILLKLLGKTKISYKEVNYNLVTEADFASQDTILKTIKENFPEDKILAEESDKENIPLDSPRLWIVDPLDGTTNFAHNIPHFSISIAFCEYGKVKCGVVVDPVKSETFSAEEGKGAFCNDERIKVSSTKELKHSVIGTGFYYERNILMIKTLESMRKLLEAGIHGIRRIGSAALDLCYVACGRFDGYFEYQLSPWDFAAGLLILTEAGGKFTDRDGKERGLFSTGVICSNSLIHDELCEIVCYK
ncbi:MAG: inositol monophosphatase [Chitinispirillaceae bacterium]|nr:inositol monophosphatase [Chitinispirillaceae bacterium]